MWAEPKKHCRYLVVTAVLSMQLGEIPSSRNVPATETHLWAHTECSQCQQHTLWGPNGNKDREQYASQALVLAEGRLC